MVSEDHKPSGEPPHESRCADLEWTLNDLAAWVMELPFDWFHERLHDAVIMLVNDALDTCYGRAER